MLSNSDAEFIAERNAAMAKHTGWIGHDALDPTGPAGHAYGISVSTRLTSTYRRTHKEHSIDISPQDVIDCLVAADVKNWVLMELHGYVGYLPMPRATQDVDIMIPYSQKGRALKAINSRWPMLEIRELSQVIRFLDPGDLDQEGKPKPVIDIMLPWSPFQTTILEKHVLVDPKSGHRIPTVEAAIVSKYAALISPHRDWDKKQQDGVDMRRMIKTNQAVTDRDVLVKLADQVWERGGQDILQLVDLALHDKPFPN